MRYLILFIVFSLLNVAQANYPTFPEGGISENVEYVPKSRFRATPYAYVDFSKGQFTNHEYALKGNRSVALSFGLTF